MSPRAESALDRAARLAIYLACGLFAAAAAGQIYVINALPGVPDLEAGVTTPLQLQAFGPAKTVFVRPIEASLLEAVPTAASVLLLLGVLGGLRLKRRRR